MSYALARPSNSQRSTLLAGVLGAHVLLALGLLAAKTLTPPVSETTMMVEMLPMAAPEPKPEKKLQPVVKPAVAPQKAPSPAPLLATTSSQPTLNAPLAQPGEPAPIQPAPSAPPAPAIEPVVAARFDADYLKNPAPPYPALSKRLGEEGRAMLRVQVSPQGTAEHIELKTSSGSSRLDEAALATVRQWRFVPARRGDTPIQAWVLVPIIFKLEH